MADKKQTKVYLIPEDETRDSHTYHYTAVKTRKFTLENKKMRLKKYNPVKRVHEWFKCSWNWWSSISLCTCNYIVC